MDHGVTHTSADLDVVDDFVDADDFVDSDAPVLPAQRKPLSDEEPAAEPPAAEVPALTEREAQILAFERQWWRHAGAKEQAIRDRFDLSATRYYQLLNLLLDKPAALEHDPMLVRRLRRLRATRARTRTRRSA